MPHQQVEAIPLTPKHVCTLVVPSLSAVKSSSTISLEILKNSSELPERSQTPETISEEQLFGSFTSSSTIGTNRTNSSNTTNAKFLSRANSNETPVASNTTFRRINSSSTDMSMISTSSSKQLRSQPSNSSLTSQKQQQQQQGSNPISLSPSSLNRRPGAIGSLSTSANPQKSSPIKIVFGQYLLVPTMDGLILIYQIIDYYHAQQSLLEAELQAHSTDVSKFNSLNDVDVHQTRIENIRATAAQMQQDKEAVEPIYSIGPFYIGCYDFGDETKDDQKNPATIVAVDDITITNENASLQIVLILSNEGDVHVLRFHSTSSLASYNRNQPGKKDGLQVEHICSFFSGNLGATCFKGFKAKIIKNDAKENGDSNVLNNSTNFDNIIQIAIGHDNGIITCFEIKKLNNSDRFVSGLNWIGNFHENSSIQSLSFIGNDDSGDVDNVDGSLSLHHQYLIVAMGHQYITDDCDPTKSSRSPNNMTQCLEIVNISLLHEEWKEKFWNSNSVSSFPIMSDYDTMIHFCNLDKFTIWPVREMLNNDDSDSICVRALKRKKNVSRKKGSKIRSSQSIFGVNIVDTFHNKRDHAFVAAMSDNTIMTIHYWKNKYQSPTQSELCWGLMNKKNKLRLSHSACDVSLVDAGENSENSIVACLRDGSVFILPVCSLDDNNDNGEVIDSHHLKDTKVTYYDLPQNTDHSGFSSEKSDDNVKSYTQGFTAGYVRVRHWNESSDEHQRSILLIFHAWACGWIDCHCCTIIPNSSKLIDGAKTDILDCKDVNPWAYILKYNGVLEDLISFLLTLDLSDSSVYQDSIFAEASKECRKLGETTTDVLDFVTSSISNCESMTNLESLSKLIDMILFGDENHDDIFLR